MRMTAKYFLIILIITFSVNLKSQEVLDQIVAVVGDQIILKSEIETQFMQLRAQGYFDESGDVKCDILEEMLFQKLLLNQAMLDSIEITNREVDTEINRRLNVFINQYGSEHKLEEVYGKSVAQIKSDFRIIIRDQLLTQKMQMKLVENISVTPADVREFYNSIPKDSLPVIDSYIEYSEIVIEPIIGQNERIEVIEKLESIRERIQNGESFSTLAVLYSEDQGSAVRGGEIGFVSREDLVPEFAAVAFNLTNTNDVSRVVKTEFGYHIIQLVEKRGTLINVRHILIAPKMSEEQLEIAEKQITEIHESIISDSLSFNEAVQKYSMGDSKFNDGIVSNPVNGSRKTPLATLEPSVRRALNQINPGEITLPILASNSKGQRVLKILRLDRKVEEHIANLEEDYLEMQEYAMHNAQQEYIIDWIQKAVKRFYIRIDESYSNCQFNYVNWYEIASEN
jgi:peptidyl-prolyl cis-trans isomerase SurA